MAKMVTQQQAILAYLNNNDRVSLNPNAKSKKYITYDSVVTEGYHFYVGKHGAIRQGNTIASSIPMTENARRVIVNKGRELLS